MNTLDATADKAVTTSKKLLNEVVFPTIEEGRRVLWDRQLKGFSIRALADYRRPIWIAPLRLKPDQRIEAGQRF